MNTTPTPRTDAKAKWVSLGTVDTLFADYDESHKIERELIEAQMAIEALKELKFCDSDVPKLQRELAEAREKLMASGEVARHDALYDRMKKAEVERDKLKAELMRVNQATCIHHNDSERADAMSMCPVCCRNHEARLQDALRKHKDQYERCSNQLAGVMVEHDRLKAELDALKRTPSIEERCAMNNNMGGMAKTIHKLKADNDRLQEALKGIGAALNECLMVPANVLPAWDKVSEALKEDGK